MLRIRHAWARRLAVLAAVSALCAGSGVAGVPAYAEPASATPSDLRVSARDTVAVASWKGSGLTSFIVELAKGPDFAAAVQVPTPRDLVMLQSLTPGTTYHLRVRAVRNGSIGETSEPVLFTTAIVRFAESAPSLTVASLSSTSLDPRWNAAPGEARYQVQLATDPQFTRPTTLTVTEPTARFPDLDTDTSYSVRVRVVDSSDLALSDWSTTVTRRPAPYEPLRVGSFNIKKVSQANWSRRRTVVASTILDQHVDVVGLQEATPARASNGKRQYTDLVDLLGSGWSLTDTARATSGEVRTAYNSERLTLINNGVHQITGSTRFGVQRYATWAVFEQKSTGKQFLFVNTHFVYQKSAAARSHRASAAHQVVQMIERVNTADLPVVIVGDFNSAGNRNSANAVYRTFTGSGYLDPLARTDSLGAAEKLINANLKTVNGYRRTAPRDSSAPMVDQIFVSPQRVTEWETVAKLDSSGRFVGTIPSDHNMIRATVYLP